ncbi:XAC2610-related protein [Cognatilysobacter segetis]|uniref:XAC2610-related protein n=1 Tax=Cognatilysobacter segetis TaxID=2492394 RepID=UPI00105B35EC|nr:hypothetical protein [Lysobacter segetis]
MTLSYVVLALAIAGGWTERAASPRFDVRVSIHARCAPGQVRDDCPRTLVADVLPRGGARPQRLRGAFPEAARDVARPDVLRVADLDFDGFDDLALCTGRDALGGAPSYTVYRYRPARGRFEVDRALGALQARSSGFFDVDRARRRLRLEAHGGSGRTTAEYGWHRDRPLRLREATVDASDGRRVRLVLGERIGGHWRERRWTRALDADWPAAFVAAEAAMRRGH